MRRILAILLALATVNFLHGQNVGVGTTSPTEKFHVVGPRALFETNYTSIGAGEPATPFTNFQVNRNLNTYVGMYINSGSTGLPFYGYALNGTARAYTSFNSAASQLEYHQTSDGTPDFFINGNTKAVFNTGFVGINTSSGPTAFTGFSMKNNVNTFYGSYIDAGATGTPFYGYALNGVATAYLAFNGNTSKFEYHRTSDGTADFQIGTSDAAFPNTAFLGIGTVSPTTGFTGLTLKKNVDNFYGAYVDAGVAGKPFYGYALNGVPTAYTAFNSTTSKFEYHRNSDAVADFQIGANDAAFPNTNFLGVGTTSPTTGFTGFAIKNNADNFFGTYVDAGANGKPFYGYALNGVPTAYTSFNATTSKFEYHRTSDGVADFQIGTADAAFPNTSFLGIGTTTQTTGATGLALKKNIAGFFGMYVDAGATGRPFYGYALNGVARAWTELNGGSTNWELNYGGTWLSVSNTGFVGINASPTASFRLDVGGSIRCTALTETSDERFKKNIQPLSSSLEKIESLNGVSWQWKAEEFPAEKFSNDMQIGFIAQEVEKVIPEVVMTDAKGYKSIDYSKISAVLTEALKDQQKQINILKVENDEMKKKFELLLKRIEVLEANR
jgi:hypothetical protein